MEKGRWTRNGFFVVFENRHLSLDRSHERNWRFTRFGRRFPILHIMNRIDDGIWNAINSNWKTSISNGRSSSGNGFVAGRKSSCWGNKISLSLCSNNDKTKAHSCSFLSYSFSLLTRTKTRNGMMLKNVRLKSLVWFWSLNGRNLRQLYRTSWSK